MAVHQPPLQPLSIKPINQQIKKYGEIPVFCLWFINQIFLIPKYLKSKYFFRQVGIFAHKTYAPVGVAVKNPALAYFVLAPKAPHKGGRGYVSVKPEKLFFCRISLQIGRQ